MEIWPISGIITCFPFEDAVPSTETILVTVTAVSEATEGEGASIVIFTVTDLPESERPYFSEASYMKNLTVEHETISGMDCDKFKRSIFINVIGVGVTCIRINNMASFNSSLMLHADCVVVSASSTEEVIYEISAVEPHSLMSAFSIVPSTGTYTDDKLIYCGYGLIC